MSESLINRWLRPEIRSQLAYQVPDSTGMIKLDAMENPYSWPVELHEAWCDRLKKAAINRYPDPHANSLRAQLAETLSVPEGQRILLGNGSDELIQVILMGLASPDRVVLSPEPGFAMYRILTMAVGMKYCGISLNVADFSLDMPAMRQTIRDKQPAVIFLAYPNNPTGNLWRREEVEEIIQLAPGLVIVDEAYAPFASDSFLDEVGRYDNLLVMRTLSKMGLAGLRLGMLIGSEAWLREFDKIRLPYNINTLTQISAEFALHNVRIFDDQARQIRHDRIELYKNLNQIDGIEAFPSEANFILLQTQAGRATSIFDGLKEQGVLIKNLSGQAMLQDCLRVTVGTHEENEVFLHALKLASLQAYAV